MDRGTIECLPSIFHQIKFSRHNGDFNGIGSSATCIQQNLCFIFSFIVNARGGGRVWLDQCVGVHRSSVLTSMANGRPNKTAFCANPLDCDQLWRKMCSVPFRRLSCRYRTTRQVSLWICWIYHAPSITKFPILIGLIWSDRFNHATFSIANLPVLGRPEEIDHCLLSMCHLSVLNLPLIGRPSSAVFNMHWAWNSSTTGVDRNTGHYLPLAIVNRESLGWSRRLKSLYVYIFK